MYVMYVCMHVCMYACMHVIGSNGTLETYIKNKIRTMTKKMMMISTVMMLMMMMN